MHDKHAHDLEVVVGEYDLSDSNDNAEVSGELWLYIRYVRVFLASKN